MLKKVYDFNQARNEFKFDRALEIKMFKEEVGEFFKEAKTTADRVDAYVDSEYVIQGSEMKSICHGKENPNTELWRRAEPIMRAILVSELAPLDINVIISKARIIVCDANEIKGKKLEDGKVSKDGFNVNPTLQIAEMIAEEKKNSKSEKKDK